MKYTKLIFLLMVLFVFSCNTINKDNIIQDEYAGVIVKKYKDIPNHDSSCFTIKAGNQEISVLADLYYDSFKYANVGDSITKVKGELRITLTKKNGEYKSFYYTY
ncbi:MAG: hypothetical protein WC542_02835 [Paludibacter sp.]|jgi:hypothetical protein